MQLNPLVIYLWGIADGVKTNSAVVAITIAVVSAIYLLAAVIMSSEPKDGTPESRAKIRTYSFRLAAVAASIGLLSTFIPSSKTIAIMVVDPAIINSEPIQKDIPELYQLAKEAMKEALGGKK